MSAGWLAVLVCLARKKSAKSSTSASNGSGKVWTASRSRSDVVDIMLILLILTKVVYVVQLAGVDAFLATPGAFADHWQRRRGDHGL